MTPPVPKATPKRAPVPKALPRPAPSKAPQAAPEPQQPEPTPPGVTKAVAEAWNKWHPPTPPAAVMHAKRVVAIGVWCATVAVSTSWASMCHPTPGSGMPGADAGVVAHGGSGGTDAREAEAWEPQERDLLATLADAAVEWEGLAAPGQQGSARCPLQPLTWQERPPCRAGAVDFSGGCWDRLDLAPPCPRDRSCEHKGRCYTPLPKPRRGEGPPVAGKSRP